MKGGTDKTPMLEEDAETFRRPHAAMEVSAEDLVLTTR
jgi:hypothetical protein